MKKNDDKTNDVEEPVLSEKDERLLKYLALIAGAMQERKEVPSQHRDKTFRQTLLEPTVIATLITVLIGGIAATGVTVFFQWRASVREFNQSQRKSLGDQELVRYTKYLEQEQALISRVYSLIGSCTSAGDNLIGLTRDRWQNRSPDYNQVNEIIQTYNATKIKWDSGALELEQLMGYYHPSNSSGQASGVMLAWREVPSAVQAYFGCTDDWYNTYKDWHKKYSANGKRGVSSPEPTTERISNACQQQYDDLMAKLNRLTITLSSAQPQPSVASTPD
jgi:hypothetical protein